MKILGISAHYHDSAAALVIDGMPIAAVQEERLSRRKNDAAFPLLAIEWCLNHAGIEPEALDAVVFYERPMLKFDRILTCALRAFPRSRRAFPKAMKNSLGEKVWVRGVISSHLGLPGRKILFTEHHQSHAAAAFLTAPTPRAAILTTDGVGEWTTLSIGLGAPQSPLITSLIESALMPESSMVNGAVARSNFTLLRMPSQPSAPLNAVDFTVLPDCVTSIQPSAESVIL